MHAELPDLCRCLVCCTVALFYIQFNKIIAKIMP